MSLALYTTTTAGSISTEYFRALYTLLGPELNYVKLPSYSVTRVHSPPFRRLEVVACACRLIYST